MALCCVDAHDVEARVGCIVSSTNTPASFSARTPGYPEADGQLPVPEKVSAALLRPSPVQPFIVKEQACSGSLKNGGSMPFPPVRFLMLMDGALIDRVCVPGS